VRTAERSEAIMNLCPACEEARHMFCDGAGQCECDLCVPYELRIAGAEQARFQLKGALAVAGADCGAVRPDGPARARPVNRR
jgi:hypothetical protein